MLLLSSDPFISIPIVMNIVRGLKNSNEILVTSLIDVYFLFLGFLLSVISMDFYIAKSYIYYYKGREKSLIITSWLAHAQKKKFLLQGSWIKHHIRKFK